MAAMRFFLILLRVWQSDEAFYGMFRFRFLFFVFISFLFFFFFSPTFPSFRAIQGQNGNTAQGETDTSPRGMGVPVFRASFLPHEQMSKQRIRMEFTRCLFYYFPISDLLFSSIFFCLLLSFNLIKHCPFIFFNSVWTSDRGHVESPRVLVYHHQKSTTKNRMRRHLSILKPCEERPPDDPTMRQCTLLSRLPLYLYVVSRGKRNVWSISVATGARKEERTDGCLQKSATAYRFSD